MVSQPRIGLVWSLLLPLIIIPSHAAVNHGQALIQWLRQHERGYFSPKITMHSTTGSSDGSTNDEDVRNGVFAEEFIAQNETLVVIPKEYLLRASSGPYTDDTSVDMCDTTWNLVREYYQGESSLFAPYIDYVMGHMRSTTTRDADRHRLPADWSDEGLALMETIVGGEMEPSELWNVDFRQSCREHDLKQLHKNVKEIILQVQNKSKSCEGEDQECTDTTSTSTTTNNNNNHRQEFNEMLLIVQEAWRTVIARSWNEVMVPIYDMMNHRNGHWHNADQLTSAHDKEQDLIVVALRDIQKGEQVYISYNECDDLDCEGMAHKYVLQQIFKDYGFVEQYPRRWRFDSFGGEVVEDDSEAVVFEIDLVNDNDDGVDDPDLKLTWLSEEPMTLAKMHFFHGHLHKQRRLLPFVEQSLQELEYSSERDTIEDYYDALVTALEMVVAYADSTPKKVPDLTSALDDLQVHGVKPGMPFSEQQEEEEELFVCGGDTTSYMGEASYEQIGDITSQYQGITFEYNEEIEDVCLYLSGWLQTCTSWRPHYHESVVHYPTRFIPTLKRVIYLGGGDNMLLHEILKYEDSLEVVFGMELDQEVVRSSFKHMGTQPHFDNPKVQWWFGDATKSLSMLLEQGDEFYGTFDLVIVDLQTNVAETLMVTHDKTIMDVAMQLLQPEGILARNEDFYPRRSTGFAAYEVDLEFLDVPQLCQQSITIGSTNVDFLTKELTGHGVETVYLNVSSLDDGTDKFARWLNYRNNDIPDPSCDGSADGEKDQKERGFGVHMILEVEDTQIAKEKPEKIQAKISNVMAGIGLTELTTNEAPNNDNLAVMLFVEGYVAVQVFPDQKYIALDVKLYSHFGKLEPARKELVAVLSSNADKPSSSSLRIVSGGMFGVPKASSRGKQAPTCGEKGTLDAAAVEGIADAAITTIVQKAALFGGKSEPVVAVVCPDEESSCVALGALRNAGFKNLIPLMGCADLSDSSSDDLEKINACALAAAAALLESVERVGKIDNIVVDVNASKVMGQILHKILRDKPQRLELLQEAYAVLSLSFEVSASSWRQALLERFQTEFDIHTTAQRGVVLFESKSNSLEVGLFSTGSRGVFHDVATFLKEVEEETSLVGHLRKVDDGVLQYAADFLPNVVGSTSDFDRGDATKQWLNQNAVGHQTILQFEIQPSESPLEGGTKILINYNVDVWKGRWALGQVVEERDGGGYAVIVDGEEEEQETSRDRLRKFENESPLEVRQPVLIRRNGFWSQGAVIEQLPEEGMFKIRGYDSDGDVMTVHRKDLVARFEAADEAETASLSSTIVHETFSSALSSVEIDIDKKDGRHDLQVSGGISEGCVITAFWPDGHAVTTWDGRGHIDISVFTFEEDDIMRDELAVSIMTHLPFLKPTSRDEMPRGTGRVVNFNSEAQESPHWLLELETPEAPSAE
ncbi:Polyamine aminopropyltransferase [Seminavis robusta]|uniref:Polyamine aminopropyltransferase n=1 Tax=Seminavis robusta TaxID=568900 RepID=A0A9N8H6V8_9STRA|nr:Polyamine aminopropyltransferase [Seminavis robusta]|eukprot:Sro159_g071840.1 Polyamine aminopropyltransferase (1427) ;mRNA; r:58029-62309